MKLLGALLLLLGSVLQAAPVCAAANAAAMASMDCENMGEAEHPAPDSPGVDPVGTCSACAAPAVKAPEAPLRLYWPMAVPAAPRDQTIVGLALPPPTPPPRSSVSPIHSKI